MRSLILMMGTSLLSAVAIVPKNGLIFKSTMDPNEFKSTSKIPQFSPMTPDMTSNSHTSDDNSGVPFFVIRAPDTPRTSSWHKPLLSPYLPH
jgi:hypothetical protein